MAFKEDGKWWVSPMNFEEEIVNDFNFPEKVLILDTTLRDGEQEPGIILTREDKVAIAKKLDAAGVHRIEAGCPMTSSEDAAAIKEICSLGLNADIYCFVRGVLTDMDVAKDCGVDGVIIEVPGSPQMLGGGMRWGILKAIERAAEATAYAHELGLKVTFFPSDASRSSVKFLTTLLNGVLEAGGHMDSVALVDTFGAFSPEGAAYMVKALLRDVGVPVEAHFHEDFGMSVPTTIAALKAGAFCAHVTVNGIGERAGSCPLEPLVMSLQCLYGIDTGIKYDELLSMSQLVADLTGKPVPATKAIVGNRLFGWETGLPTGYWQKSRDINPLIMMPYHFNMTGQPAPHIYIGKKSGGANVALVNERLGLAPVEDKDAVKAILDKVKTLSIAVKRDLTDEEYIAIYNEVVK